MPGFDPPANFFVNVCDIRPIRNSSLTGFGCYWLWLKEEKNSRDSKVPDTELFFHVTYPRVLKWSHWYRNRAKSSWRAQDCGEGSGSTPEISSRQMSHLSILTGVHSFALTKAALLSTSTARLVCLSQVSARSVSTCRVLVLTGQGLAGSAHCSAALEGLGASSGRGNCAGDQHWKTAQSLVLPSIHKHFLV